MLIKLEKVDAEYRGEYYVPSVIRRLWLANLELLKEIDRICGKYGLTYYAAWGTMLGAVRHKGFIPWDDDIDIEMPRKSYEVFRRVAGKELTGTMRLVDILHDDVKSLFLKVISSSDKVRLDQDYLDRFHGCPYQTAVDIMCVDRIPDDEEQADYMVTLAMHAYGLGSKWSEYETDYRERLFRELQEITGVPCPDGRSEREHCIYLSEMISAMYMDDECEYSGMLYYYDLRPERKIHTSSLEHIIRVPFEDFMIPILADYDEYLTAMFGADYMTPVKWGNHPFLHEAIEAFRNELKRSGQKLPAEFDLPKER